MLCCSAFSLQASVAGLFLIFSSQMGRQRPQEVRGLQEAEPGWGGARSWALRAHHHGSGEKQGAKEKCGCSSRPHPQAAEKEAGVLRLHGQGHVGVRVDEVGEPVEPPSPLPLSEPVSLTAAKS